MAKVNRIEGATRLALKWLLRKTLALGINQVLQRFSWFERLGMHVTPVHFYSPIPNTRELLPVIWQRHSDMIGVDMREENQLTLLERFYNEFHVEYDEIPRHASSSGRYFTDNHSFRGVDGEILYCFVRSLRPKAIIEVGSGFSTQLISEALLVNQREGSACNYSVIDPYPDMGVLSRLEIPCRVMAEKVEHVPLDVFESLGAHDILFIDSSHALRMGGDVQFEYLEVLPRLHPGVVVHVHDIFLPAEYPEQWVKGNRWFWTEQYLLQSFLAFNCEFEVLWGGSYMSLRHPNLLSRAFRSYSVGGTFPGSFWLRRI